jgi:hypothetical protein
MNRKLVGWIIPLVVALLVTGCGNDPKDELKQPNVYRDPQVRITHAPTVVVIDVATVEAEASAIPTDVVIYFEETEASPEEIDQAMIDEIDALLNKIENALERIDTEP